jgi:hypothetical protein
MCKLSIKLNFEIWGFLACAVGFWVVHSVSDYRNDFTSGWSNYWSAWTWSCRHYKPSTRRKTPKDTTHLDVHTSKSRYTCQNLRAGNVQRTKQLLMNHLHNVHIINVMQVTFVYPLAYFISAGKRYKFRWARYKLHSGYSTAAIINHVDTYLILDFKLRCVQY